MLGVSIAHIKVKSRTDEKACDQLNNDMHRRNICIELIYISSFSVALDMVLFSPRQAPRGSMTVATSVGRSLTSAMPNADAAAILTWWCIASRGGASPSPPPRPQPMVMAIIFRFIDLSIHRHDTLHICTIGYLFLR